MARQPKKTLTDRLIKTIKPAPEGTRKQVMDALVPGFGVRVTDKGGQDLHLPGALHARASQQQPAESVTLGRVRPDGSAVSGASDPARVQ